MSNQWQNNVACFLLLSKQEQTKLTDWRPFWFDCKNEDEVVWFVKTISPPDHESVPAVKYTWLEVKTQYLVIQLTSKLTQGLTYQLYTEFTGELADDLSGFYRSEYYEDGVQK